MACDRILEYISDYFDENLSSDEKQLIDEHLKTCPSCRGEYERFDAAEKAIIQASRSNRQGVSAGPEFESRMREALRDEKMETGRRYSKIKKSLKKTVFIAAAIILCFTLAVLSPASAAIRSSISDILDYAFRDKGIANSLELGLGQAIEQSVTDNDLTFTIHNYFSDKNRSIILFSAKYAGILEKQADDMRLGYLSINYQSGSTKTGGYSGRFKYDERLQQLQGILDLTGTKDAKEIEIGFDSATLYRQKYVPLDLKLSGETMKGLNLEVDVDLPGVKKVVIKDVVVSNGRVIIEYDTVYIDPESNQGSISLNLKCKSEDGFLTGGSYYDSHSGISGTAYGQIQYNLNNTDLSKCWLELTYPEPVNTINGDWSIRFQPDKKAAKASNKTVKINKKFAVEEKEFKVTKIDFSPSATVVHVEGTGISPVAALNITGLRTQNGFSAQDYSRYYTIDKTFFKDRLYGAEYSFEPVYNGKGISMAIGSAMLPKEVHAEITLDTNSLNEQSVMLDGEEFLVSCKQTGQKGLEVALNNQYPIFQNHTKIRPDGIYLTDSDGSKLYPEENSLYSDGNQQAPAKNIKAGQSFSDETVFTFRDAEPGKYTLTIESIEKFQDINLEVDLLN